MSSNSFHSTATMKYWSSSRVDSWYHLLILMVLGSMPAYLGASVSLSGFIIKLEVDVGSGDCQSFIIKVLPALFSILSPPDYSANTTQCWWWHAHQTGRNRWNTGKNGRKNQAQTQCSHQQWHYLPREFDAWVCRCRRYFRSILTLTLTCIQFLLLLGMLSVPTNITWNGPSWGVCTRKNLSVFRKKTSSSLVCNNVLHQVDKKALCSTGF